MLRDVWFWPVVYLLRMCYAMPGTEESVRGRAQSWFAFRGMIKEVRAPLTNPTPRPFHHT
eukprot:2735751-Rhodomonas_salina.3